MKDQNTNLWVEQHIAHDVTVISCYDMQNVKIPERTIILRDEKHDIRNYIPKGEIPNRAIRK